MMQFILLSLLFLCSCGNSIEKDREAGISITKEAMKISQKYNLPIIGSGGFNEGNIKGYTFSFKSSQIMDYNQARELIVNIVEEMIINSNKEINKPIGIDNLNIDLYFYDPMTQKRYTENIGLAHVLLIYNEIRFVVQQIGTNKRETILVEPYSEAYEKVTGKKYQPNYEIQPNK